MHCTPIIQQDNAPCNSSIKYSRVIHIGVIFLLTIIRYVVHTGAEINHISTKHKFITNTQTGMGYVNNYDKNRYL